MSVPAGVPRLLPVVVPGPAGTLEGLLQVREPEDGSLAALVCHPHPLHGGTLHNKVVHRVASVLVERGAMVLRINFRGVGKSEGRFDEGIGELEDARAAFHWLRDRAPRARLLVSGFSFGSWVAARLTAGEPAVERLVLVAPPVTRSEFSVMRSSSVPKLVIQGTRDTVCSPEDLEREFPNWADPKRLLLVEGASHFFDKQLGGLANALNEGLSGFGIGITSSTT